MIPRTEVFFAASAGCNGRNSVVTQAGARKTRLFNDSELVAPFELSRLTIKDYVTLLEWVFLLD